MKKLVLFMIAALAFSFFAVADETGPYLPLAGGGTMYDAPNIALGGINGRIASISVPCYAMCNITKGACVVLATSLTTTPMAVTLTTTVGDKAFLGIALAYIPYGKIGQVVTYGIADSAVAISVALGDELVTSSTAGSLTATSAITEGSYTVLSATAIVGRAAQYKTRAVDSSGTVYRARVFVGAK